VRLVLVLLSVVASVVPARGQCPGDLNGDRTLTIADIVSLVAHVLDGAGCGAPTPTATRLAGNPTPTPNLRDPARFRDLGNGTIRDGVLHLVWEKKSSDGSVHDVGDRLTHDEAEALAVALSAQRFGGRSTWRLPTSAELFSLVQTGFYGPHPLFETDCVPGCTIRQCSCTDAVYYWAAGTGEPGEEFFDIVYGRTADAGYDRGSSHHAVRAVSSLP